MPYFVTDNKQRLRFTAETKYLMRCNLADSMLPQQSLSKPKAGFTPPMMGWLRESFVMRDIGTDTLLGSTLKNRVL
jgi:hypothetical protein